MWMTLEFSKYMLNLSADSNSVQNNKFYISDIIQFHMKPILIFLFSILSLIYSQTASQTSLITCANIRCRFGFTCKNGKCIPNDTQDPSCAAVTCVAGSNCVNGKCQPICSQNQIYTKYGCIKSCKSPEFQKCPDIFPLIYNPSYCGLNQNGKWTSYSFQCQACKSAGGVGVLKGACNCSLLQCPQGYGCTNDPYGQCFNPQTPCTKLCKIGYKCVNNQCVEECSSPNQVYSPIGCIKACTHPDYKNCPDSFIQLYNPRYCAYKKNGDWVNYTFDCQACQNSDVVGVVQQPCSCSFIKCSIGKVCSNGECVLPNSNNDGNQTKKCNFDIECPSGYACNGGICKAKCWNNKIWKISICKDPRPNLITCPLIRYIRQPDNKYCGLTFQGEYLNFPRQCQACMNSSVILYYDVPCDELQLSPICSGGLTCSNGICQQCGSNKDCPNNQQCINGDCQVSNRSCKSASDCQNYENCLNGICIDRCFLLRCANCKYGICGYSGP